MSVITPREWTLEDLELHRELLEEFKSMKGDVSESIRLLEIKLIQLQESLLEGTYEQIYRQVDKGFLD